MESKAKQRNVTTVRINYKKSNDIVLQSRRGDCLEMGRISKKVIKSITEKMESRINRGRQKFSKVENPERYLPRRCAFGLIICNAPQLHIYEVHWWLKIYKISRTIQSPCVHRQHQAVCKKGKRIGD